MKSVIRTTDAKRAKVYAAVQDGCGVARRLEEKVLTRLLDGYLANKHYQTKAEQNAADSEQTLTRGLPKPSPAYRAHVSSHLMASQITQVDHWLNARLRGAMAKDGFETYAVTSSQSIVFACERCIQLQLLSDTIYTNTVLQLARSDDMDATSLRI